MKSDSSTFLRAKRELCWACLRSRPSAFLGKSEGGPGFRRMRWSEKHFGVRGSDVCAPSQVASLSSQVKGRAVKIRPKTKDWLQGLQEEIIGKRDSVASASPTANSCLLEENFDFTSLDYESEGESGLPGAWGEAGRRDVVPAADTRAPGSVLRPALGKVREDAQVQADSPCQSWVAFTRRSGARNDK